MVCENVLQTNTKFPPQKKKKKKKKKTNKQTQNFLSVIAQQWLTGSIRKTTWQRIKITLFT